MRRESYLSQPSEIEIYPVFSGTDVILRQSIELVEREEIQDGKKSKYKVWECDEVQFHYNGEVTEKDWNGHKKLAQKEAREKWNERA